jgi:hypothetical protein
MFGKLELSRVYGIDEDIVTDDTVFLTPKVASLYTWWRRLAVGRLPLRREFDVLDHWHSIRDLFLVEALADGQFLMALEGERVIQLFGVNNSGQLISEATGLGNFGHAIHDYYTGLVRDRACRRCVGNLERVNNRGWIEFESIDCPLSRDGDRVDFIIGVIDVIDHSAIPNPSEINSKEVIRREGGTRVGKTG